MAEGIIENNTINSTNGNDTITNNNDPITNNNDPGAQNSDPKMFTQEEVMALIQSEADKRVTQALSTQKKKYERQLSLSKLDGDAREKAEKDNEIAELREKLAQFQVEKNKSELKSVLGSRGLSAEFADIISISDDIEASQANIDKLDKLFKAAVKAEVDRRLAGNSPKKDSISGGELTKEKVAKMTIAELSELEQNQPEVFKRFFN